MLSELPTFILHKSQSYFSHFLHLFYSLFIKMSSYASLIFRTYSFRSNFSRMQKVHSQATIMSELFMLSVKLDRKGNFYFSCRLDKTQKMQNKLKIKHKWQPNAFTTCDCFHFNIFTQEQFAWNLFYFVCLSKECYQGVRDTCGNYVDSKAPLAELKIFFSLYIKNNHVLLLS